MTLATLYLLAPAIIEAILAPFLEPLAHRAEQIMCGEGFEGLPIGALRSAVIGVRSSAQVLVLSLCFMVPCWILVLFSIPGLVVVFVLTSVLTGLVWFEIPFARRGYGFRHRYTVLRHNWARALGFGMAFQIGMAVPFFNLFVLTPAATLATTVLYFHFEKGESRA